MGKLSDILNNGLADDLRRAWDTTDAADDFGLLPPGEYVAHIVQAELESSRSNSTPGYKLTFRVIEGEHSGRQFWHDIWLTAAALPMAKRDLGKLGVTSLEQLETPLPRFIRCKAKLVVRRNDNGTEFNRVRRFDVLGIDKPEPDAFAPAEPNDDESGDDDDQEGDGQPSTEATP